MEFRALEDEELQRVLKLHKIWQRDKGEGERADLRHAYLRGADLRGADLRGADLSGAYLRGADLRGADLRDAYLRGAYLRDANLSGAYLRDAYLRGANLSGANLSGADLRDADLRDAYLRDVESFLSCGQSSDGHELFIIRHKDGIRIKWGCQWFTETEALDYWGDSYTKTHKAERQLMLNHALARVELAGWTFEAETKAAA